MTNIPANSPVNRIIGALDRATHTSKLVQALSDKRAPEKFGSAIEITFELKEALDKMDEFPTYRDVTQTSEERKKFQDSIALLKQPGIGELVADLKSADQEKRVAAEMALFMVDTQMEAALKPKIPQMISEAVAGAAKKLDSLNYDRCAKALAKDLGLEGKLTHEEIQALGAFMRQEGEKVFADLKSLSDHVDDLKLRDYMGVLTADLKEGVEIMQRLHKEFAA